LIHRPPRHTRFALSLAVAILAVAPLRADDDPPTAAGPAVDPATPIVVLDQPTGLDELLKRIAAPDYLLLRGPATVPVAAAAGGGRDPAIIESVEVSGTILDGRAHLRVAIAIRAAGPGASWVPIGLGDQVVRGARSGDRPVPLRHDDRGWLVEAPGPGPFAVAVDLLATVAEVDGRRSFSIPIPRAAVNRLAIDLPGRVERSWAAGLPVLATPVESGEGSRLVAALPPRDRLDVEWIEPGAPGPSASPLLVAQGEIDLTVDALAMVTRSDWVIESRRGTVRRLAIRIDPAERLVSVELDDEPAEAQAPPAGTDGPLVLPMAKELGPGQSRRLRITTRRSLRPGSTERLDYRGPAFPDAALQTGFLSVAQGENLWIEARPRAGLSRIDPRELPETLRARVAITTAFRFADLPFALELAVEPAAARPRVATRATVALGAVSTRLDARLDLRTERGRLAAIEVEVPKGLAIEEVGPPDLVATVRWPRGDADADDRDRLISLTLTDKARDARTVGLHLVGTAPPIVGEGRVPLPTVAGAEPSGTLVAVIGPPELAAGPGEGAAGREGRFDRADPATAGDWPWPGGTGPAAGRPALWLRAAGRVTGLPLRVEPRERTVVHEVRLTAHLAAGALEVIQDVATTVRNGTIEAVDVAVPAVVEPLWGLDAGDVTRNEALGIGPDGLYHHRLALGRPATDSLRIRFRYRLPLGEAGATAGTGPRRVSIPRIRLIDGATTPVKARLTADPGLIVGPLGPGWSAARRAADGPLDWAGTEPDHADPAVELTTPEPVATPAATAEALWLRSTVEPGGDVRTTAWYRLRPRDSAVVVDLPGSATLLGARLGSGATVAVDRPGGPDRYRFRLPASAPPEAPIALGIDYRVGAARAARGWEPPRLVEGGLGLVTRWEVRLPWTRAIVGEPAGWSDENDWHWDRYVWKRRPALGADRLAAWVGGIAPAAVRPIDADRAEDHAYLFGRSGPPPTLRPIVVARSLLVAACSGLVLVGGLALVLKRPSRLPTLFAGLLFAFAVGAAASPSVAWLLAQSSAVGLGLTALAALVQSVVDRQQRPLHRVAEPSDLALATGSSLAPAGPGSVVGSDDSTAIRRGPPPALVPVGPTALGPRSSTATRDPSGPAGGSP